LVNLPFSNPPSLVGFVTASRPDDQLATARRRHERSCRRALFTRHDIGIRVRSRLASSLALDSYESAVRVAANARFRTEGAPTRNHGAIIVSKIMQPNAELGMNGQMGLPRR
jgi:hypothetical protein